MSLANIVSSKGEKLRRELLKAEFSKEDKQKASKVINNSGSGNVSKYAPRYYKYTDSMNASQIIAYISTVKARADYGISIVPTVVIVQNNTSTESIIACSFIPIYILITTIPIFIDSLDTLISIFKKEGIVDENMANEILSAFTEITEDEYYKID